MHIPRHWGPRSEEHCQEYKEMRASRVTRFKPAAQMFKKVREGACEKHMEHHMKPYVYSEITDSREKPPVSTAENAACQDGFAYRFGI